ncbi:MAG: hypothetical protein PUC38_01990 [Bacteroidales bacterium]|nr:hypothetical protein [Bacteroidales bacterium]
MKKQYISPSCLVMDIYVEQAVLSGSINLDEEGTELGGELTNKKETGFGSSPWDNMGETGNF